MTYYAAFLFQLAAVLCFLSARKSKPAAPTEPAVKVGQVYEHILQGSRDCYHTRKTVIAVKDGYALVNVEWCQFTGQGLQRAEKLEDLVDGAILITPPENPFTTKTTPPTPTP